MPLVIVGLGGNDGEPLKTLRAALEKMKGLGSSLQVSKFYRTKPISPLKQPNYLNAVATFETDLNPKELFLKLEAIETSLGKIPKAKDAPRPIDLDLLFYGDKVFESDKLVIPHSRWKERLFVLIPLAGLLEEIEVAGTRWNIKKLINHFPLEEVQEIYNDACAY